MVSRFVIHVGPHKTGTTYLQEHFARLRPFLAERGILYPKVWGPVTHHALYERLAAPGRSEKLESEFAQIHRSDFARVLISCEGLQTIPREKVLYLRQLLGTADVSIVYYVRSWADTLPSHWKEELKGGRFTMNLPEFLYRKFLNPKMNVLLNFAPALDNFARVFGEESIKLVAFDRVVAEKHDLFLHFAERFLDLRDIAAPALLRVNVSYSAFDSEIVRMLATLEWQTHGKAPPVRYFTDLQELYIERRSLLEGTALAAALNAHLDGLLVSEISDTAMLLHERLFKAFGHALVAPHYKRFFFIPRTSMVRYVRSDYLARPGIAEELLALHEALKAGLRG